MAFLKSLPFLKHTHARRQWLMPLRYSVTLVVNLGNETGRVFSAGTRS